MKKLRPAPLANSAKYPTLAQSRGRRIWKKIAVGAAVLTVGPLMACVDQNEERSDTTQPDVVVEVAEDQSGVDTTTDQGVEISENEMPSPGGMVEPEYFSVRLPESGFSSLYLDDGGYLTYGLLFVTYDVALADHFRSSPDEAYGLVAGVLASKSCDEIEAGGFEAELMRAINDGASVDGEIHQVTLEVEYCDPYGGLDGDMPEPDYP